MLFPSMADFPPPYNPPMLYDISRTIGADTLTYPGDDPPRLAHTDSIACGAGYNGTHLHLSAHCGTHLDAPAHFIPGGARIAELPLERFRLDALVADAGGARVITAELVAALEFAPGMAVLFKTANARLPRDCYSTEYVHLDGAAGRALAGRGAGLVGIDYLSVDSALPQGAVLPVGDGIPLTAAQFAVWANAYPVHHALLGAGALLLEDADLRAVPPGRYRLYCFPLRLDATEASPVRAVLEG